MTEHETNDAPRSGMPQWTALIPVALLLVVGGFFAFGLTRDPHELPAMMVDRPMPEFELEPLPLETPLLTRDDLLGKVTLVNVFGSWCVSCVAEHPYLMDLTTTGRARIVGVDWRDEAEAGAAWLRRYGNPYQLVGLDADSRLAIELGVTGAPETFVVDKAGRVRFKQVGPISPETWEKTIRPLVAALEEAPE